MEWKTEIDPISCYLTVKYTFKYTFLEVKRNNLLIYSEKLYISKHWVFSLVTYIKPGFMLHVMLFN